MFHVKCATMDITTGQFKLKAKPKDAKVKYIPEKQDFIAVNARSFFV